MRWPLLTNTSNVIITINRLPTYKLKLQRVLTLSVIKSDHSDCNTFHGCILHRGNTVNTKKKTHKKKQQKNFLIGSSTESQFSSVPWLTGSSRGHEGKLSRDPLPVFSVAGYSEQFWYGQEHWTSILTLSIHYFLCQPQHHPPSSIISRMVLERLSWCVIWSHYMSFHLLAVARRGSYGPTRKSVCSVKVMVQPKAADTGYCFHCLREAVSVRVIHDSLRRTRTFSLTR